MAGSQFLPGAVLVQQLTPLVPSFLRLVPFLEERSALRPVDRLFRCADLEQGFRRVVRFVGTALVACMGSDDSSGVPVGHGQSFCVVLQHKPCVGMLATGIAAAICSSSSWYFASPFAPSAGA